METNMFEGPEGDFQFCITLDQRFCTELPIFLPGQTIKGKVVLIQGSTSSPKSCLSITISALGFAKVKWRHGREVYFNRESYFNEQFILYGNDRDEFALHANQYLILPFCYTLPNLLPSSFASEAGSVNYYLEATMRTRWYKKDKTYRLPFIVRGILNLSLIPGINDSFLDQGEKVLSCAAGRLGFRIRICKGGFVPGEVILFDMEIYNDSGHTINFVALKLMQNVMYEGFREALDCCDGSNTTKESQCILAVKSDSIMPGDTITCCESDFKPLRVPPLPPTDLGGRCDIIKVRYFLKIEMDLNWASNLKKRIPIVIGTQPLINAGP